jgi:endonuclease-8
MAEGPLLVMWKEDIQPFIGRKVTAVENNTKLDADRLLGKTITDVKTWGKHFLICFDNFTLRIHFLMFGDLYINRRKPPEKPIKLSLQFTDGELVFYNCALRFIEEPLYEVYDWSADVMNDEWDPKAAMKKLKAMPDALVCDALLNQDIFSGIGNIIKNEVLFRVRVQPLSLVGKIPGKKWDELLKELIAYSYQFLEWRRAGEFQRHWEANARKLCPRDKVPFIKAYLGENQRRSYYCTQCQVLYH